VKTLGVTVRAIERRHDPPVARTGGGADLDSTVGREGSSGGDRGRWWCWWCEAAAGALPPRRVAD
jgi:hypothetical protein